MHKSDKSYLHMVVEQSAIAQANVLCLTAKGEPSVYADAGPAELLASQFREIDPTGHYRVISFVVL